MRALMPALVTGGAGYFGSVVTAWLQEDAVQRVHVMDRSGRTYIVPECDVNAEVTVARCDLGSSEDVRLSTKNCYYGTLLHTEGKVQDISIVSQTSSSIRQAFTPKCGLALWGILDILGMVPQSAPAIMFSSSASMLGSPGQSSYSSATSLLDLSLIHI